MKYSSFLAFLVFLALPAYAQTENDLCQKLARHVPADDVAYKPGIDVHGNAVVPADLNSNAQILVPDVIEIPLAVDLAQRLGGALPQGVEMNALIGFLQITKDGRVLQNGQDLTDQAVYLCKDSVKTAIAEEYTHESARPQNTGTEAAYRH